MATAMAMASASAWLCCDWCGTRLLLANTLTKMKTTINENVWNWLQWLMKQKKYITTSAGSMSCLKTSITVENIQTKKTILQKFQILKQFFYLKIIKEITSNCVESKLFWQNYSIQLNTFCWDWKRWSWKRNV